MTPRTRPSRWFPKSYLALLTPAFIVGEVEERTTFGADGGPLQTAWHWAIRNLSVELASGDEPTRSKAMRAAERAAKIAQPIAEGQNAAEAARRAAQLCTVCKQPLGLGSHLVPTFDGRRHEACSAAPSNVRELAAARGRA